MLKVAFAAGAAVLLVGCASGPADTAAGKPVIRSVAIVPATLPRQYSLRNKTALQFVMPLVGVGYRLSSMQKENLLSEKLPAPDFRIDEDLTAALAGRLRGLGYQVTVLADVPREPSDPDGVRHEGLAHGADALLHVYFSEVGVESPRRSTDYLPRVNVSAVSYVQQNQTYPYETTVYYGIDASARKADSIEADPKQAYPDFDYMLTHLDRVRADFRAGVALIGQRVAEQAHAAFK